MSKTEHETIIDYYAPPPASEELEEEQETKQALDDANISQVPWKLVGGSTKRELDIMGSVSQFAYHWDDPVAFNDYLKQERNPTEQDLQALGYKIQYIHNKESNMKCAVITRGEEIYIGFRGTLTTQHVLKDLNATLVTSGFMSEGRLHGGFYHGFRHIMPQLSEVLDNHAKSQGKSLHDYNFNFCGHSMGGALAKIAALYINKDWKIKPEQIKVATFGDPRVFDIKGANLYDQVLGRNTVRVSEYGQDIVSHVPSGSMGFKHVGAHIKVETPNNYQSHSMNGYQKALKDMKSTEFVNSKSVTRLYHISQAVRLILDYIPEKVRIAVKHIKEAMGIKHWHDTVKKPDSLQTKISTPKSLQNPRTK